MSPIWNLFPKDRDYNQENAEGSKQQGNGKEIMEMLREMRKEMKERDKQMKLQLWLRNEYMDVELRRRDQYMEETLRQRHGMEERK